MIKPPLADSTGNALADSSIQNVIARFEHAFPAAICAYYVEGSYADRSAVATSDLDMTIVFRAALAADEQETARTLIAACQRDVALELDVAVMDVAQLRRAADPMFKLGARLVRGQDIREHVPLMPIAAWAMQRMHAAFWLMIHVFGRPQPVGATLDFPDANDVFRGYAARPMRLGDGSEILTTRDLVRVAGWIATARIAHEAGRYVASKRACAATYRTAIGDQWSALLERIDRRCRQDWQYRIPPAAHEQTELRAIGEQVLAFEQDFLARYTRFVLAELASDDDEARAAAGRMLDRTPLADPTIRAVVRHMPRQKGEA